VAGGDGFRNRAAPLVIAGDPAGAHVQIDATGISWFDDGGILKFRVTHLLEPNTAGPAGGLIAGFDGAAGLVLIADNVIPGKTVLRLAPDPNGPLGAVQAYAPTRWNFTASADDLTPTDLRNGGVPIGSPQPYREINFPNIADFTTTPYADWITGLANIPVPSWAADGTATAEIVITVQAAIITAATQFDLRVVADTVNGSPSRIQAAAVTQEAAAIAAISYTIPAAATSIPVKVQAQRNIAAGALRASAANNTLCIVDALIHV